MKTLPRSHLGTIAALLAAWTTVAWGGDPQMPDCSFTPGFIFNTSNSFVVVNFGEPVVFAPQSAGPPVIRGGTLTPDYEPTCIHIGLRVGFTLSCPPNLTVTCEDGSGAIVNYTDVVIATNVCGPSIYSMCDPPSGSKFAIGVTEVHCRVPEPPDPGWLPGYVGLNLAALAPPCSFFVTVNCPVVIFEQPQSQSVVEGDPVTFSVLATGYPSPAYQWFHTNQPIPGATSADLPFAQVSFADAGTYFCRVTNTLGEAVSSNAVLTVNPPCIVLTCPVNITVDCTNATVNYGSLIASNLCDLTNTPEVWCLPPSGYHFSPGTWLVLCFARGLVDGVWETNQCSFTVTVVTNCPPACVDSVNTVGYVRLSVPAGGSLIANQLNGTNNNIATILPTAPEGTTAIFLSGGTPVTLHYSGGWDVGTTQLEPGNSCFVTPGSPTTFTLVGEVPQGHLVNLFPAGPSYGASMVPQAGRLQTDLGFPPIDGVSVFLWTGSSFSPPYSYAGGWTPAEPELQIGQGFRLQADSGFSWSRDFLVPRCGATVGPPLSIQLQPNGDVQISWPGASSAWRLIQADQVEGPFVTTPGSPASPYLISAALLESKKFFALEAAPSSPCIAITCPANITADCTNAGGTAVSFSVEAVNTCDGNPLPVVCTPPSGHPFPRGTTPVFCYTYGLVNTNYLTNSCTFDVIVLSNCPSCIAITCPTNPFVFTVPCGSNCVPVDYPLPTVVNGVLLGCNPPPGTCLPVGSHNVTCTASNACGITNCIFPVTVNPVPPVSITCPSSSFVFMVQCGSNCVPVDYPLPTVADGGLLGCIPPPGTCLPVGNYFVTCRASNTCGTAACQFPVTVLPGSNCPPALAVAFDDLSYPNNSPLLGQNGGRGWSSAWGPANSRWTNHSESLVPPGVQEYVPWGGSAAVDLPPSGVGSIRRNLDIATTNVSELWFSVVLSASGGTTEDRFVLNFGDIPLSPIEIVGAYNANDNSGTRWTIRQSPTAMGPVVKSNEPTLLVIRMVNTSPTVHDFYVSVNPTLGTTTPPAGGILPAQQGTTIPPADAHYTLPGTRLDWVRSIEYDVSGDLTHHVLGPLIIATNLAGIVREQMICNPNLLVNGSFELPDLFDLPYMNVPGGGDGSIPGWRTLIGGLFNNGVELYRVLPAGDPLPLLDSVSHGAAADGDQAIDLAPATVAGGGIQQTFATVPGKLYHVLFKMGTSTDHGRLGTAALQARVLGASSEEIYSHEFTAGASGPTIYWVVKKFDFTASGTSATIEFTSHDNPATSFVNLDDVRVTDCPPSTCIEDLNPPPIVVQCTNAAGNIVDYPPLAINRCYPTNQVDVVCVPPSGSLFQTGPPTPVVCTISTQVGAVLETLPYSFTVKVEDSSTPPVITWGADKEVECGSEWNFDPPTVSAVCCTNFTIESVNPMTTRIMDQTCGFKYQITWKVTDCEGALIGERIQTVIGKDTTPPVLTCPRDRTIRVDASGRALPAYSRLYTFSGSLSFPLTTSLVEGRDGVLYGTTSSGGRYGYGTVFKVNKDGSERHVLLEFGGPGSGGLLLPSSLLEGRDVEGSDRPLYGNCEYGGCGGFGTPFRLNKDGSGLVALSRDPCSSSEYEATLGALIEGSDRVLYGASGGSIGLAGLTGPGLIFRLNKDGTSQSVVERFSPSEGPYTLLEGSDGVLYGTTIGGIMHQGTVIKANKDGGMPLVLVTFGDRADDGRLPTSLIEGSDGMLYGTTAVGGDGFGTIFRVRKDVPASPEYVHRFAGAADGVSPRKVIEGRDGKLYAVTCGGGIHGHGSIFQVNKDGTDPLVLFSFDEPTVCPSTLIQGSDGALYGADTVGVFRFDPRPSWDLEQPTAVDACGTGVTITEVLPRVTTGNCPQIITRTWYATDGCGNQSTNCSQTVRLFGPPPPVVIEHGTRDNFVGPEPASPRAELVAYLQSIGSSSLRGYDEGCVGQTFADSFTALPPDIVAASLRIKLRSCATGLNDDIIFLGVTVPGGVGRQWSRFIGGGNGAPGLLTEPWLDMEHEFVLDLAALPNADGTTANLLSTLNELRYLDIMVPQATVVDFAALEYRVAACPTLFSGLNNTPIGSAIAEVRSNQLVIRNFSNVPLADIPQDGDSMRPGAMQFGSVAFECLDAAALPTDANLTFRAIGEVNHTNNQVVATFQALDVGADIEYRARFDALGDVPLLAVLYNGSNVVGSARIPTAPAPHPPIARVPGAAGDARITPYMPRGGHPTMVLEFLKTRPVVTLTGGQSVNGTRLVITPDVPKVAFPDRALNLADDLVNPGLNFWWQDLSNSSPSHAFIGSLSEIQVLAAFVPQVTILSEEVGMFGLAHESVGGALLKGLGDSFKITPVTNQLAAEQGFDIIAGGVDEWGSGTGYVEFEWLQLNPPGGDPATFLRAGIIGTTSGSSNEMLTSFEIRQIATDPLTATAFHNSSNHLQQIEVRSNGVVVASTVISNGVAATFSQWPNRFSAADPAPSLLGDQIGFQLSYGWDSNVTFTVPGLGNFTGNELRDFSVNGPQPNPRPDGVGIRFGGGLSELHIIRESRIAIGPYFHGLAHRSLSNATLQIVGTELVISNAANAASFGASIALGDSDGGAITLGGFELSSAPEGSTVEIRSRGTVDGVPDQAIGTLRLANLASGLRATVDHTPLGVSHATAVVLDGSAVVDATEDFLSTDFPPALFARLAGIQIWNSSGGLKEVIRFDDRRLISLNGGSGVLGIRVEIKFFDILRSNRIDVSSVTRLEVVGTGLPSFRITEEELGKFHRGHLALGRAKTLSVGDWVWVGNMVSGAANPDGVEFPLAGADTFSAYWRELDPFDQVPPGAMLRASVSGAGPQPLPWSQITSVGSQKEITANFSGAGASSLFVEVLQGTNVVHSTTFNNATGTVAQVNIWPVAFAAYPATATGQVSALSWSFATVADFSVNNRAVSGDAIRVTAEGPGQGAWVPKTISLQASGISEINLVGDIEVSLAPITAKLQTKGGVLVLSWDTANPGQVLQSADNVDGPWIDVPGAITSPYIVRPVGLQKFLRVIQR